MRLWIVFETNLSKYTNQGQNLNKWILFVHSYEVPDSKALPLSLCICNAALNMIAALQLSTIMQIVDDDDTNKPANHKNLLHYLLCRHKYTNNSSARTAFNYRNSFCQCYGESSQKKKKVKKSNKSQTIECSRASETFFIVVKVVVVVVDC